MCNNKKYPLSLNGEAFKIFKEDFDKMLGDLLYEMEKRESEDAVINIKMAVNLESDTERDYECNGYDGVKDITKPTFKHEISTVMTVKNKKTGTVGGGMKMVWDKELCQYVMQEIDNGQTSLFESGEEDELPQAKPLAIGDGSVIEAKYTEMEQDDGEGFSSEADDLQQYLEEAIAWLSPYAGCEMKVTESMGNYAVRTADGKHIILSSAIKSTDIFYCSKELLEKHMGHKLVCTSYSEDDIVIECADCDEVIYELCLSERNDAEEENDYGYDEPEEN